MNEVKINKQSQSITFINNGIAFSQFGIAKEILDLVNNLQNQLHQKENIIKEVREYIESYMPNYDFDKTNLIKLLEILDKVGDEK